MEVFHCHTSILMSCLLSRVDPGIVPKFNEVSCILKSFGKLWTVKTLEALEKYDQVLTDMGLMGLKINMFQRKKVQLNKCGHI